MRFLNRVAPEAPVNKRVLITMKKRTEILMISLVLSSAALAAALTSDDGLDRDRVLDQAESQVTITAPAPESSDTSSDAPRGASPIVYDMDIPADVLKDYGAAAP